MSISTAKDSQIKQAPKANLLLGFTDDFSTDSPGHVEPEGYGASGYELMVQPTDFNYETLTRYMDLDYIVVPPFQHAYTWNIGVASRFIESMYIGWPVPEIYLFEHKRDKLWVVDGQQRLLTMYFFQKNVFPKPGMVVDMHQAVLHLGKTGKGMPAASKSLYSDFRLQLGKNAESHQDNVLHGKSYSELKGVLQQTSIRAIAVADAKQSDTDSVAYEIFERLNTGGMKMSPQQIRMCIFQSPLLDEIQQLNLTEGWRQLAGQPPARNARDAETILQAIAMLVDRENYDSSLNHFLNRFASKMRACSDADIKYYSEAFKAFLEASKSHADLFHENGDTGARRFRVAFFEAVFVATMRACYAEKRIPTGEIDSDGVHELAKNLEFQELSQDCAARKESVFKRHEIAINLIEPL